MTTKRNEKQKLGEEPEFPRKQDKEEFQGRKGRKEDVEGTDRRCSFGNWR